VEESLQFLEEIDVPYELVEHGAVYTIEEAMAESALKGRNEIKNLFIQDDKGKRQYLVVMPGLKQLDLKTLAADLGEKKVRFCSAEKVERILGVKPGSVSLFCCLSPNSHHVKVIIDEDLLTEKELGFHPIVNTAAVFIQASEMRKVTEKLVQEVLYTKL